MMDALRWLGIGLITLSLVAPVASGGENGAGPAAGGGKAPGVGADAGNQKGEAKPEEGDDDEPFLRGADLDTDYEADLVLRRARELLEMPEPQYHQAAVLLQHLIDTAGNVLATEDGLLYVPVREKAEELLARLPAAGIEAYRAEVDGQVQALLGDVANGRDERALETVAERFFLSSRGPEAAFSLGCLYLDEHRYARARRSFARVLRQPYGPLPVPRAQVLLRLALACHRSGDGEGARAAWAEVQRLGGAGVAPESLAAIGRTIAEQATARAETRAGVYPNAEGRFASPAADSIERPRGLWLVRSQLDFDFASLPNTNVRIHVAGVVAPSGPNAAEAIRAHTIARWEQGGWTPAGTALVRADCAFFKTNTSVVCLDMATGKARWEAKLEGEKGPARTQFVTYFAGQGQKLPAQPYEVASFGDRIGKMLDILDDTLYFIEDNHQAHWVRQMVRQVMIVNGKQVVREAPKVARGNRLAALDAATGKLRWQVGRTLDENDPLGAVRFVALPIACGGRLLVPFETESELELAALEPATGRLVWRTFLCAYTASQQAPWYPVGVASQGTDVYVSTGQGVVLALDGIDGAVRWASRYERDLDEGMIPNMFVARPSRGWQESRVFPRGRRLLVLPNDAERILLFDAPSGMLEQQVPAEGLRYCLGLADDGLLAGSDAQVARIALPGGEVRWRLDLASLAPHSSRVTSSLGRGFLAADALFIPSGGSILRVAADTGKVEATLWVDLPGDEPVGSLFSDGKVFGVYGLGRVYMLKNGAVEWTAVGGRLAALQKQRDAADPAPPELTQKLAEALLARARLHGGYGRLADASADYRTAFKGLGTHPAQGAARDGLFRALMDLVAKEPPVASERLREALEVAASPSQKAEARRALAADYERQGKIEDAVRTLLAVGLPSKDDLVELEGGKNSWRARPDVVAAAGLRGLLARHGDRVALLLAEASASALKAARAKGSFEALQAVLRAYPGTPAAIQAGLEAAAIAEKEGVLERAEIILQEMAAAEHRPTAAAGVAGMAALHQRLGWLRQAHGEWSRLAEEYGQEKVPSEQGPQQAGELARQRLAEKALAAVDEKPPAMPAPPWRLVWEQKAEGGFPYINAVSYARSAGTSQGGNTEFLEQHLFLFKVQPESRVVCRRLRDGATVYERDMGRGRNQQLASAEANVAVWFGTRTTVFGLASGKELWSRDGQGAVQGAAIQSRLRRGGWSAAATPVLALRPDASTVRVHDLATGGLLWERTFRGSAVGWVAGVERFVVLSSGSNQDLMVYDALTGEFLSTIDFEGRYVRQPAAVAGGLLVETYGNAGQRAVALYDLASGKPRWRLEPKEGLRTCFAIDDDTLCAQVGNGDLHLIDPSTGQVRTKIEGGQIQGYMNYPPVLDPTGKRLYVNTYGGDGKLRVSIIDLEAGKTVRTTDVSGQPFQPALVGSWAAAGGLLPVVIREAPRKEGNRFIATNLSEIKFLDAATGTIREDLKLPLPRGDGKVENLRTVMMQDGVIVVNAHNLLMAFGHDDGTPAKPPDSTKPSPKAQDAPATQGK